MSIGDIAGLIVGLGVGGVFGAAANVFVAANRVRDALDRFGRVLPGADPSIQAAFSDLRNEVNFALSALDRLKRALKWK